MNLQQLKILVAMGASRTLKDVAERLDLSQPTVIFHLKKMEQALNLEIYRKNFRRLVLTDAGKALLPYAEQIMTLIHRSELLMKDFHELKKGKIRIASSHTPATYFLPRILSAYKKEHPDVQIVLSVRTANHIIDQLNNYETDLGIISYTAAVTGNLTSIPLMADELRLILPATHPLAHKEPLTVDDLKDIPLITHENGTTTRVLTDQWARDNGFSLTVAMELGSTETIKEAVRCGIGIGVLPYLTVKKETHGQEIVIRDLPNYTNHRFICLVFRQDNLMSPVTQAFIEFIKRNL